MKFLHCFCVVDSSLRILWVGGDWDDFALRNGGTSILANDVLATRLTDYITDNATAGTVQQMVAAVIDTQGSLRMDYRCDGPEELRRFRLTIKPMKDGRVIMVHELRDAIRLDPPMGAWSFDPAAQSRKCSVCGLVHAPDGPWIDPTLPGVRHPPLVRYTVCPSCITRIELAIAGILDGAEAGEVGELILKAGFSRT
ncbi:MAG: hypothetical protein Q7J44_17915 [Pseudotabrizicola sp.]|uniref:hypothetical protein n=1 Tax=Pseudotabrizicola sp. TaxID=2939647 RepID=UPI0027201E41|nr:hypothetical protein [Pseudotabrizicola sp.]MDO9640413.1 hypothetical protein [Pseudotabrizicola sp.]